MTRRFLMASASLCVSLAACSLTEHDLSNAYRGKSVSMAGAGTVLDKPFEPYDEAGLTTLIVASSPPGVDSSKGLNGATGSFSQALYRNGDPTASLQNQMRDARNEIQGMLLTSSSNRCNAFKQLLRSRSSDTNFLFGSLATTLGAAGAIVSGGASQALAGAAAGASGVGAEYNKDIMSSVTTSVIIPGIDKQRSSILQEITNRRCLGVSSYTLTQAMADAVRYHAACSTDVGVAAAGSAVGQTNTGGSPSLQDAENTADAVTALHAKLMAMSEAPADGKAGKAKPSAGRLASGAKPAQAAKDDAGQTKPSQTEPASNGTPPATTTTLLGDEIDYLQCPSLQADGTLDMKAAPKTATSAGTAKQAKYGAR